MTIFLRLSGRSLVGVGYRFLGGKSFLTGNALFPMDVIGRFEFKSDIWAWQRRMDRCGVHWPGPRSGTTSVFPVEQQAGESQRSVATTGTVLTTRGPVIPATGTQTKLGKGTYILDAVVRLYAT